MKETTVCSVQEAYNLGYEDGFKTASTHTVQTRFVKERTCRFIDHGQYGECTSCGFEAGMYDGYDPYANDFNYEYCPNCGARVVEVE